MPGPLSGSPGIFSMEGTGQVNRTAAASEVLLMKFFYAAEMGLQRPNEAIGKDGDAFAQPLPFADGNLAIAEIDILHAKAKTFEEAQSASI